MENYSILQGFNKKGALSHKSAFLFSYQDIIGGKSAVFRATPYKKGATPRSRDLMSQNFAGNRRFPFGYAEISLEHPRNALGG